MSPSRTPMAGEGEGTHNRQLKLNGMKHADGLSMKWTVDSDALHDIVALNYDILTQVVAMDDDSLLEL